MLEELFLKAQKNISLTYDEGVALINTSESDLPQLLGYAEKLREQYWQNKVVLCGIVNAKSGKCTENCSFCAQSAHHETKVDVYALLSEDDIVAAAKRAKDSGSGCFSLVTAGRGVPDGPDFERILAAVARIKKEVQGIKTCVSLGIISQAQAERLKQAGLDKFHHNLETAESFFEQMCTTHSYKERIQTIYDVKAAGLKVCSGGIFGIGETPEQCVELAIALQKLDIDSAPLNIVTHFPGTKIYNSVPPLTLQDILRLIATYRFLLPSKIIGVFGGRQVHLQKEQAKIFKAGANSILIGNYLTTTGYDVSADMRLLQESGLVPTYQF
jgi:biotin synthase